MTLSLRSPGAAFTKTLIGPKPAILSAADLYLWLGGSEAQSIADRNGKASASVVGTPVYEAGYCTLNASNGFQAPLSAAGQPFTYVSVFAKAATNDTVVYFGNWTASTPRHAVSTANSTNDLRLGVDGATRVTTTTAGGMRFVAASHDGTTANLYRGVAGSVLKSTAAFTGGAQTSVFRAGGTGTGGTNTYDMAAVAYWQDVLTDGEVEDVYEYLRAAMALRGVTVA